MIEAVLFANALSVLSKDKTESIANQAYKFTIPYNDKCYTVIYNRSKNKVLQLTSSNGEEFILDQPILVTLEEIKSVRYRSATKAEGIVVTLSKRNEVEQLPEENIVSFKEVNQELITSYFLDNMDYILHPNKVIETGYLFEIYLTENQLQRCKNNSTSVRITINNYHSESLNFSRIIDGKLYTNNLVTALKLSNRIKFFQYTESQSKTNNLKTKIRRDLNYFESEILSQVNNYEVLEKVAQLIDKARNFHTLVDLELI